MAYTEPQNPQEAIEEVQAQQPEEEIAFEETPMPRRDYSRHFNRFAPEIIRREAAPSRKKSLLWGIVLLLIGLFFLQTAFTGTFGVVGILIYSTSGVITSAAGVFRLISGIRGKASPS